jgi:hypothetical protein
MDDDYNKRTDNSDNIAKMLALIAITLAIIALGWAIKADNRAGDAQSQTTIQSRQVE